MFVCPMCQSQAWGSFMTIGGTWMRMCHGRLPDGKPCPYEWPASQDAALGIAPPSRELVVAQAARRR